MTIPPDVRVHVERDSYAHRYSIDHDLPWIAEWGATEVQAPVAPRCLPHEWPLSSRGRMRFWISR